MTETLFNNARIVLSDRVVAGHLVVRDGEIAAWDRGSLRSPGALDMEGDYLIPGLVELHTDNLEKHLQPRAGVHWPTMAGLVGHDSQIVSAGITTVFDALFLGDLTAAGVRGDRLHETVEGYGQAVADKMMKADHFLHLRCEVNQPTICETVDGLIDGPRVRLISINDHSPGQRQFSTIEKFRHWHKSQYKLSDAQVDALVAKKLSDHDRYAMAHRRHVVESAHARGLPLASHDDETLEHVSAAVADGMHIAEFPTTMAAAKASREAGLAVLMGAPNLMRGGSHSGNVSAGDLAAEGLLDILSSDYAPACLLAAAFMLQNKTSEMDLPAAVATVTRNPARAVGLEDRGEIAVGKRADLLLVHDHARHPLIRGVWCRGGRVA